MDLYEIVDDMKTKPEQLIINWQENINIRQVRLYSEETACVKSDYLYVIYASQLQNLSKRGNFLCIPDCPEMKDFEKTGSNLIILQEEETPESLVAEIETILFDGIKWDNCKSELLKLLSNNRNLEEIFDVAYTFCGNPIRLESAEGKNLYYTKDEKLDETAKLQLLSCESETVYNWFLAEYPEVRNTRLMEKLFNNNEPVYFPLIAVYPQLCLSVKVNQQRVACVVMLESDHSFRRFDYKLLTLLADMASYLLQTQNCPLTTNSALYHLVHDILDQQITDSLIIEDRIKSANLQFLNEIYLLVFSADLDEQQNTSVPDIMKRITELLGESKAVIYQNKIIILITCNTDKPLLKVDLKDLIPYLAENHMHVSISNHFEHFRDFFQHYHHTLKILEIGLSLDKKKTVYSYEDYGIYLFMTICSQKSDIQNYCHPTMINLLIYDKKHGTNLAHTLYLYLHHRQNQLKTSKELKIHRSTLTRHINMIEKITKLDLNDANESFHLKLTYEIMKFLK